MVRIERKSSIENEPRTLNISQMQFARDAAQYVVNTMSIEEAFKIFTEGLEPVASVGLQNERAMKYMGVAFDCLVDDEEVRIQGLRDIATAPF